jgi:hypothetical protein
MVLKTKVTSKYLHTYMREVCVPDMFQEAPDSGSIGGIIRCRFRRIWLVSFFVIRNSKRMRRVGGTWFALKKPA